MGVGGVGLDREFACGWDLLQSRVYRGWDRLLGRRFGKWVALIFALVVLVFSLLFSIRWLTVVALLSMFFLGVRSVSTRLFRRFAVRRILAKPCNHPADAMEILPRVGLVGNSCEEIVRQVDCEVVLAEWGREGTVLCHGAPLVGLGKVVDSANFQPRLKNRVQLVCCRGRVAIKKWHVRKDRFENEILALDRLAGRGEFPALLGASLSEQRLYRSFSPGDNLADLLAAVGFLTWQQDRLQRLFLDRERGRVDEGSWKEEVTALRQQARECLLICVGASFVADAARVVQTIHQNGVSFRDLKYGNFLVREGRPVIVDFDIARTFQRRGLAFQEARRKDLRCFDHLFSFS